MLYAISDADRPARFASVGHLINDNEFLHYKRILDSYELISVTQGVLHINAENREYHVGPGEFVILFPGECHYGTKPSDGPLSFYWVHFYLDEADTKMQEHADERALLSLFQDKEKEYYILPETGQLSADCRTNVLFIQLLDLAKRFGFSATRQCSYALSTMLLELTNECLSKYQFLSLPGKLPQGLSDVLGWLSINYDTDLSVNEIAGKFGYHPSYLTSLFKKYTGQTVTEYINRQRIQASLNLLVITPRISLEEISEQVGFSDVKYFMRLFKRYEGVTPTNYRKTFSERRTNRY